MKLLFIFADMVRANHMKLVSPDLKKYNEIDQIIKKFGGGTLYTNCFTEAPDTPRGLATFYSGKRPTDNGCDTRQKWPRYFLKNDLEIIFDKFIEKKYAFNFFSNPNERRTGMFPEKISQLDIHNQNFDLAEYLDSVRIQENHLIFISLPDYHWALDDWGYNSFAERKAGSNLAKSIDIILEKIKISDIDHIFLFSDHGFKLESERFLKKKQYLLNEDRTQVLMFYKGREDTVLKLNSKLCSLSDIYYSTIEIMDKIHNDRSLFSEAEREYIIVEDHLSFDTLMNQFIELWAVIKKEFIYIRDLKMGYLYDRTNGKMTPSIRKDFDEILVNHSTFGAQVAELNRIEDFRKLLLRQDNFMHGGKRQKVPKYISRFLSSIDIVLKK